MPTVLIIMMKMENVMGNGCHTLYLEKDSDFSKEILRIDEYKINGQLIS